MGAGRQAAPPHPFQTAPTPTRHPSSDHLEHALGPSSRLNRHFVNGLLTRSCQLGLVSASALRCTPVVPSSSPSLPREGLSLFRRSLLGRPATSRLGRAALS